MVGCSIRNCKSRSVKGGTIMFFSFPLKESVANEWLRYCGPKTTTKNGRVCSNHFLSSDYFKTLQQILLNESPRKGRKLKPDALPTLLIDDTGNQNTLSKPIEVNGPIVDSSGNMKNFPEHITTPANDHTYTFLHASKVVDSSTVNTSDNIKSLPEYDTTPANDVVVCSKIAEKSNKYITIPLAEYKRFKRSIKEYDVLKKNLERIFTPGQIRCFMKPQKRRVRWSAEDIAAAISLRRISPQCYRHLRANVGIPLPAFSTLRNWASQQPCFAGCEVMIEEEK